MNPPVPSTQIHQLFTSSLVDFIIFSVSVIFSHERLRRELEALCPLMPYCA